QNPPMCGVSESVATSIEGRASIMSKVHTPAGVAGAVGMPVLGRASHASHSVLHPSSFQSIHVWRMLAVAACVLALIASTAASSLAAPEAGENEGGYTYADMGYNDPNEAVEAVAQDTAPSGQFIANYAMQFLGYPYVAAGNGPGGFDCSGFTQFVILNT